MEISSNRDTGISGDAIGGNKNAQSVTIEQPDYAALLDKLREGDTAAQAELLRVIFDSLQRVFAAIDLFSQRIEMRIVAIDLLIDRTDGINESLELLRKDLRLRDAIQQQIEVLRDLSD